MARKKTKGPLGPTIDFVGSVGMACVLLMCLFVLVFDATLHYKQIGEAGVKQDYFVPWIASIRGMPFPGGRTVFSLLALSLFTGGIVRIRWVWRTAGVIVAHLGIIGLAVAGVVNFTLSDYGHMRLYEGDVSDANREGGQGEVVVWDAAQEADVQELLISDRDLRSCADQKRTFSSPSLPFDVEISGFLTNCGVSEVGPTWEAAGPEVDGWALRRFDEADDPRRNTAGIVLGVVWPGGDQVGLLTAYDRGAWTIEVEGKSWAFHLHPRRHTLPFTVELKDTHREFYPGTRTPRTFRSDVLYDVDGVEREARISMNNPLRTGNYVLYQSSWDTDRFGEWTGLAVTRNPSDQWPKWSCWVTGAGLLLAFAQKLLGYIAAQSRARARKGA